MAGKSYIETDRQCRNLIEDARRGVFKPVYLLMGEEPHYPERVCEAILAHALLEHERDFNQTIFYGADVTAEAVIDAARRFPMMAERQLVVVKEAQQMRQLDQLAIYCEKPLDSTVLVLLMHGASADKRKSLYKSVLKVGVVVESNPLRDYELPGWIEQYYREKGLQIAPDAAALLAESAGADLERIAVETEKLLKNLPEGATAVQAADIKRNVGISRQFSIFELTKALSYARAGEALRLAFRIGETPRFALPMAVSALFIHYYRVLRYGVAKAQGRRMDNAEAARLLGVNPYFLREYAEAIRHCPPNKAMKAISLLSDYDYKGKGGETGGATPGELLVELVSKLLNI